MSSELASQGSLFSADFLQDSIRSMPEWGAFDDARLAALQTAIEAVVDPFPTDKTPNETQTEDDLIWPVLRALGWSAFLRQQNLSAKGRDDVPDGLLFEDDARKARANSFHEEWKRYEFGLAAVESKRWLRPLDRRSGRRGEELAPSTQMLRYLRRIDDLTSGGLRWGILTNGARWRLYYQGARSVSEQFFELDLAAVLNLPGHNEGLFALDEEARRHWLKVFALVFGREAFLPSGPDPRTFHQRALEEGKYYEERVADNLSRLVFEQVYPTLIRALAAASPEAGLQEVREAALILLYRLLFILYAEDRDLLPVRDTRYDDYGLREKVRLDVGDRFDRGDVLSDTAARYWGAISDLFIAINQGDGSIGLPPYNGGLFDAEKTPLLTGVRIAASPTGLPPVLRGTLFLYDKERLRLLRAGAGERAERLSRRRGVDPRRLPRARFTRERAGVDPARSPHSGADSSPGSQCPLPRAPAAFRPAALGPGRSGRPGSSRARASRALPSAGGCAARSGA